MHGPCNVTNKLYLHYKDKMVRSVWRNNLRFLTARHLVVLNGQINTYNVNHYCISGKILPCSQSVKSLAFFIKASWATNTKNMKDVTVMILILIGAILGAISKLLYSETALPRKPFAIGYMYIYTFLLRITDTTPSQNIYLSFWDSLSLVVLILVPHDNTKTWSTF